MYARVFLPWMQSLLLLFLAATLPVSGKEPNQASRTKADFAAITAALKAYRLNAEAYPTTKQGLAALVKKPTAGPIPTTWTMVTKKIPKDEWETPYNYRLLPKEDPRGFELKSAGPDKEFGTEDDLSSLDDVREGIQLHWGD